MARDKEKYQYLLIGLLKDSDGLRWLLEDAKQHHMEDQLAKLAAIRLTEFYEQQNGRGGLIPLSLVARLREAGVAPGDPGALPTLPRSPATLVPATPGAEAQESDSMARYTDDLGEDDKRLSIWEMPGD